MVSSRELFKQGYNASNNKQYDKAKKFYRNCLEIDPDYSMAWNNLGWILYDQNQQFKEAEKCYNQALKADKKNYYAWNNLGILFYRHKKKFKQAERYWKKSVKLYPDFKMAWQNLGVLYKFQLRNPKKSDNCYQRVTDLDKKNKSNSGNISDIIHYKCKECGNPMEKNQIICEKCGFSE
ncbi:tetratricopeptide repeat protein [Promethearchaeum syntrophicum]|uniref:Tetratricopeptide repeat protein n=1 Tax=Promethearchaeum syntrophicum TaxID=2594042 RepID=A0A5B9DE91_9ARCH|nr:tetratricopeptide repeat protein [Candidatus Prometheoarchaeum syntrophicum]QEE17629.1 lipoprotein NlpI [Candidatus Prometheoarchaeum syntrophicum]